MILQIHRDCYKLLVWTQYLSSGSYLFPHVLQRMFANISWRNWWRGNKHVRKTQNKDTSTHFRFKNGDMWGGTEFRIFDVKSQFVRKIESLNIFLFVWIGDPSDF